MCKVLLLGAEQQWGALPAQLQDMGYEVGMLETPEAMKPSGLDMRSVDCILVDADTETSAKNAISEIRRWNKRVGLVVVTAGDIEAVDRDLSGHDVYAVCAKTAGMACLHEKIDNAYALARHADTQVMSTMAMMRTSVQSMQRVTDRKSKGGVR